MLSKQQVAMYDRDIKLEEDILDGLIFGIWMRYAEDVLNVENFNMERYLEQRDNFLHNLDKPIIQHVNHINQRVENIIKKNFPFFVKGAPIGKADLLGATYIKNAIIFSVATLDNTIKTVDYMKIPPEKAESMVESALDGAQDKIKLATSNSVLKGRSIIGDELADKNGIKRYRVRTMQDDLVRESHQIQDGKEYDEDDPFRFVPGEDPNCRCIKEYINERNE